MSQTRATLRRPGTPQGSDPDPHHGADLGPIEPRRQPFPRWQDVFPDLAAGDAASRALMDAAHPLTLAAGQAVFRAGAPCERYVLILGGSVRVQIVGESGREATLYRVLAGQSCVLTSCCVLAAEPYPAEGLAETPVCALSIGKGTFDRALESAPAFRRFVFANLGNRIAAVISRMEEISCRPVERRLATYLLARVGWGCALSATHQQIAVDIGSAREVVSRHLKRFEVNGLVRLGLGSVEVCDSEGLRRLVDRPL